MMNLTLKHGTLAALICCATSLSGWTAESQTYQFDDWKLTITPGPTAAKPTRTMSKTEIVPSPKSFDSKPTRSLPRIQVQQVSMKQSETVQAPAPVPAEPVPALKVAPEAPPVVPGKIAATVVPTQPDCCGDLPIITPRMADVGANATPLVPQTALYRDIYFSIPFNRAEYNANPSYRHDATMELLFNQMRPTVIQRGTQNVYHFGMGYGYDMGGSHNYAYGPGYGYGPGFPQQYYPYNYGLRIHSSR